MPSRNSDRDSKSDRLDLSRSNGGASSAAPSLRRVKTGPFVLSGSSLERRVGQFSAGSSIFASRWQAEEALASQHSLPAPPPSPRNSQPAFDHEIKDKLEALTSTQASFAANQGSVALKVEQQAQVVNEISSKIDGMAAGMVSQKQFLQLVQSVDTLASQNRELIENNHSLSQRVLRAEEALKNTERIEGANQKKRKGDAETLPSRLPLQPARQTPSTALASKDSPIQDPAPGRRTTRSKVEGLPLKLTAGALALQAEASLQHQESQHNGYILRKGKSDRHEEEFKSQHDEDEEEEESEAVLVLHPSKKLPFQGDVYPPPTHNRQLTSSEALREQPFVGEGGAAGGDSSDEEASVEQVMDLGAWMRSTGRTRRAAEAHGAADRRSALSKSQTSFNSGGRELSSSASNTYAPSKRSKGRWHGDGGLNSNAQNAGDEGSCFLFRDEDIDESHDDDGPEESNAENNAQGPDFFRFTASSISQDF
jgi:hypothetical protein